LPYREKIGWLSLVALVITFGPYFMLVAMHVIPLAPLPNVRQLIFFGIAAVMNGLIVAAGIIYFRSLAPDEAGSPPDERDRAIIQRSLGSAYYVLITGMIIVGLVMPFNSAGWTIINAAVFMIVIAEVVRNAVLVASYRRQA
jgi:hypothetical protein